jgi:hypothetical protein
MPVNPNLFFDLDNNYNLTQLKEARDKKLTSVASMSISNVEKQVYMEQVMRMYKKAKKELDEKDNQNQSLTQLSNPFSFGSFMTPSMSVFSNINEHMNQINNMMNHSINMTSNTNAITNANTNSNLVHTSVGHSMTSRQRLNPDGSVTVIEISNTYNNGQKQRSIKTYKKLPDGTIQNMTAEEAAAELSINNNYHQLADE